MIGDEFDVEDGRALVTGYADWSGREYVTIRVTRPDHTTYVSCRLAAQVEQYVERSENGDTGRESGTEGDATGMEERPDRGQLPCDPAEGTRRTDGRRHGEGRAARPGLFQTGHVSRPW